VGEETRGKKRKPWGGAVRVEYMVSAKIVRTGKGAQVYTAIKIKPGKRESNFPGSRKVHVSFKKLNARPAEEEWSVVPLGLSKPRGLPNQRKNPARKATSVRNLG